jgi:hypothetical protein
MNKYIKLISSTTPSCLWKFTRTLLNWITIPIKLVVIGAIGVYGILYNKFKYKKRPPEIRDLSFEQKQARLKKILKYLPVLKNDQYELYLPRQPLKSGSFNGADHNTDHQLLRQGQYVFLMSKLGRRTPQMENALSHFMQGPYLLRGYKWDYQNKRFINNAQSTSGDMLLGLCLAMLDTNLANETQSMLLEKFDQLVSGIVDNDYALLEGSVPKEEPYISLYNEQLKKYDMREEKVKLKSSRAMWQPGLETVGAQALTLLAALKTNAKKNKSKSSEKEYWNVFYKQGYALLSLLPTCYLPNKRGYFNDHNCVNALYILLKLADTKFERLVYKFALRYVFLLSKSWYNSYFVGLIHEVAPELLSEQYIADVCDYLYEEDPLSWTLDNAQTIQSFVSPIPLGTVAHSEFAYGDKLDRYNVNGTGERVFTGLSELAAMVLLDDDYKDMK